MLSCDKASAHIFHSVDLFYIYTSILVDIVGAITDYVSSVQAEYQDWHCYRNIWNTFEEDMAYVEYYEALVKETKV